MTFTLHTTYEALKKRFLCYIQRIKRLKRKKTRYIHCMKRKKGNFGVTYDV